MKKIIVAGLLIAAVSSPAMAAKITLYSEPGFAGDSVTIDGEIKNLNRYSGWNDRAKSLVVHKGHWEICKHADYKKCKAVLSGQKIADLGEIGLFGEISSLRPDGERGNQRDDRRDGHGYGGGHNGGYQGGVIWQDNSCQEQVKDAFRQRFGTTRGLQIYGDDRGGVKFNGETWNFQCSRGRINIW